MSKPMTKEELDELRRLAELAEPHEWTLALRDATIAQRGFIHAVREAVPRMLDQLAEAERFRAKIVDEAAEREPETAWVPNELRRLLKRTDGHGRRPAATRDPEPRAEPELLGLRPMNEAVLGPRVEVAARGRRVCADPDRAAGTGERSMSGTVAKRMSPRELAARLRLAAAQVELWEFEPPGLKERYELAGELEDLRDQADPSRDPEGV